MERVRGNLNLTRNSYSVGQGRSTASQWLIIVTFDSIYRLGVSMSDPFEAHSSLTAQSQATMMAHLSVFLGLTFACILNVNAFPIIKDNLMVSAINFNVANLTSTLAQTVTVTGGPFGTNASNLVVRINDTWVPDLDSYGYDLVEYTYVNTTARCQQLCSQNSCKPSSLSILISITYQTS